MYCLSEEPNNLNWTGFDDSRPAELPPSESGFFTSASAAPVSPDKAFGDSIIVPGEVNASINDDLIDKVKIFLLHYQLSISGMSCYF